MLVSCSQYVTKCFLAFLLSCFLAFLLVFSCNCIASNVDSSESWLSKESPRSKQLHLTQDQKNKISIIEQKNFPLIDKKREQFIQLQRSMIEQHKNGIMTDDKAEKISQKEIKILSELHMLQIKNRNQRLSVLTVDQKRSLFKN